MACFYVSLCVFIPKATPTPNTQMEHLEERSSVTSQAEDRHCSICPPPLCSPCRSWKLLTGMFPPTLHSDLSLLWQSFLFGSVQCWFHCCSDERITVWWLKLPLCSHYALVTCSGDTGLIMQGHGHLWSHLHGGKEVCACLNGKLSGIQEICPGTG